MKWFRSYSKFPVYETVSSCVLQNKEEIKTCLAILREANLRPHRDKAKNWDSLIALNYIGVNYNKEIRILDAGAEYYSVILPWLQKCGYKNLTGNNLKMLKPIKYKNINYVYGDITSMDYEDNYFDVITCLSVIEHGVNPDEFFLEMRRVLNDKGTLIVSTDYYETEIETRNQYAYGVPIKIFSKKSISSLIDLAKKYNFTIVDDIDLSCDKKIVHWKRFNLSYTFIALIFRLAE